MDLLQQIAMAGVVLLILGGALWMLKRKGMARFAAVNFRVKGQRRLEIVERLPLTPQHTLCLVRVGDRTVLIGTAPSNCSVLHEVAP
jgi:flagellar biosynthetic protein FliO